MVNSIQENGALIEWIRKALIPKNPCHRESNLTSIESDQVEYYLAVIRGLIDSKEIKCQLHGMAVPNMVLHQTEVIFCNQRDAK